MCPTMMLPSPAILIIDSIILSTLYCNIVAMYVATIYTLISKLKPFVHMGFSCTFVGAADSFPGHGADWRQYRAAQFLIQKISIDVHMVMLLQ